MTIALLRLLRAACAGLVFIGLSVVSAHAQTTALYLESQSGDTVGAGATQTLTLPAVFVHRVGHRHDVHLDHRPIVPVLVSELLGADRSAGAGDIPFRAPFRYSESGEDRRSGNGGCNETSGRFWVREIERNPNGTIARLAVDFEQHCNNDDPALFGALRYNSNVSTLVPFDGAYPAYSLAVSRR